jgi:predicted HTH domain antitoxin
MHTLTADEVTEQPRRLLENALRGQADIVMLDGEPVMLTLPLGPAAGDAAERLALAITLYERDLVSLGLASKVAGLGYSQMIDELGRRQIPVVRYSVEDLDEELAFVRTLAGR